MSISYTHLMWILFQMQRDIVMNIWHSCAIRLTFHANSAPIPPWKHIDPTHSQIWAELHQIAPNLRVSYHLTKTMMSLQETAFSNFFYHQNISFWILRQWRNDEIFHDKTIDQLKIWKSLRDVDISMLFQMKFQLIIKCLI